MKENVVIYIRVSDPSQIDNNSLDTQDRICRQYAESKGFNVVRVFREEGYSAKSVETRPSLKELLSFSISRKNKISGVLVYKLDRFSRNLEEGLIAINLLAQYGVRVMSVTENTDETPMGRAMRNILMTLGQLDNELKGSRVKDNMQAVFDKGLWPFKPPIGYKRQFKTKEENKGLPVIKHPELAPIISKLFKLASKGIYNKTQLAKFMNLDGFADYYVREADHKIVHLILSKTFYHGLMYAEKWNKYSQGIHEPIIDDETWNQAYRLMILKKRKYKFHDVKRYPLKGAIKCFHCSHPMTTSPSQGCNGIFYYYECKNKNCKKVRVNVNVAHKQFLNFLSKLETNKRVIKLFEKVVIDKWDLAMKEKKNVLDKIDIRISSQKEELTSIRKAKDEGIYTVEQAREEAIKVNDKIKELSFERLNINIQKFNMSLISDFTNKFLSNITSLWESLDLSKRQAFLEKVFLGEIFFDETKKIQTNKLSPSFQLIYDLAQKNGENVPPPGIEPGFVA